MAGAVIRVIVVDDHPVIGYGLERLLRDAVPEAVIVGTATSVDGALEAIREARPDVVICDLMLGEAPDGLRLLELVRDGPQACPVVIYSAYDIPALVLRAMEGGAAAYLRKSARPAEVAAAVRAAASGKRLFDPDLVRIAHGARPTPSEREREILRLVAAGSSNEETARQMALSPKTIESHLRRMFMRYGVFSRSELIAVAREQGWLLGGGEPV
ncbi:MAG: response regulator transcription factor [Chloroflexi bacterium]|nr:response regulator transcription factor [Chloroflexota bacterium]